MRKSILVLVAAVSVFWVTGCATAAIPSMNDLTNCVNASQNYILSNFSGPTNGTTAAEVTNIVRPAVSNALVTATNSFYGISNPSNYVTAAITNGLGGGGITLDQVTNVAAALTNQLVIPTTNGFIGLVTATNISSNMVYLGTNGLGGGGISLTQATNVALPTATNVFNGLVVGVTNSFLPTVTNTANAAALTATNNLGNTVAVTMTNVANQFSGSVAGELEILTNATTPAGVNYLSIGQVNHGAGNAADFLRLYTNLNGGGRDIVGFLGTVDFSAGGFGLEPLPANGSGWSFQVATNLVDNMAELNIFPEPNGGIGFRFYTNGVIGGFYPNSTLSGEHSTNLAPITITNGIYYGNGGGLTNIQSTNIVGLVAGSGITNNQTGVTLSGVFTNSTFYGNGSGLTNLNYSNITNFYSQNTVFIDAINGSDLNTGTQNYPWSTIGKAQASVAAGWTVAVAPGTYADSVTNFGVSWYLCRGATVTFNTYQALAFTNTVSGDGTVALTGVGSNNGGNPSTNILQYLTVHCADFQFNGVQVNGAHYNIYCDVCDYLLVSRSPLAGGPFGGTPAIPSEFFNVYCRGTISYFAPYYAIYGSLQIQCYASKIIFYPGVTAGALSSDSVLSAVTGTSMTNCTFNSSATYCNGFTWAIGSTTGGGDPQFPSGMKFVGNPMFDHSVTATNSVGQYNINGSQIALATNTPVTMSAHVTNGIVTWTSP